MFQSLAFIIRDEQNTGILGERPEAFEGMVSIHILSSQASAQERVFVQFDSRAGSENERIKQSCLVYIICA